MARRQRTQGSGSRPRRATRHRRPPGPGWWVLLIGGLLAFLAGAAMFAFPGPGGESASPDGSDQASASREAGPTDRQGRADRLPAPYSAQWPAAAGEAESAAGERAESVQRPLAGRTIALDPGNNGRNDASRATRRQIAQTIELAGLERRCDTVPVRVGDEYDESAFVLAVARVAYRELTALGADVVLTRTRNDGIGPCLDERSRVLNGSGVDLAVSIHSDGVPDTLARGFHLIYPAAQDGTTDAIHSRSVDLARGIRDAIRADTGHVVSNHLGHDGLDQRRDLALLNASSVPIVVLEAGNPANAQDLAWLTREGTAHDLGRALAGGIREVLAPNGDGD